MTEVNANLDAERNLPSLDQITIVGEPIIGSVQTLYPARHNQMAEERLLVVRASDGGSVFDVGTFFEVPGSGAARNTLRHRTFTELSDPNTWQNMEREDFAACFADQQHIERLLASPMLNRLRHEGMPTHHIGLIDPTNGQVITGATNIQSDLVLIRRFPVIKPERAALQAALVYDYYDYNQTDTKVMALEHIVRLGNAGGSSLQDRYNAKVAAGDESGAQTFLAQYGLQPPLQPWSRLPNIAFDWTTKYEDRDRPLSLQETLHVSGVPAETMHRVVETLTYSTVYARKYFANLGLQLWDMKWEVAVDKGEIIIADTLDHDSIRVTAATEYAPDQHCQVHFNKQAVRDYLRIFHADWHAALGDAKQQAAQNGSHQTFLEIYNQGVSEGIYPTIPVIDPEFIELQRRKYNYVTAASDSLTSQELCRSEIAYYQKRDYLDAFLQRNAIR